MKKILYLGLLIAAIGGTTSLAVAEDINRDGCSYIGQGCTCSNTGWSGKCVGSLYKTSPDSDPVYKYYCHCEPSCTGKKCTCHDWENEGVLYHVQGIECECNCSEMEECARIAKQPESSEQCNALKAKQCQRFPSIVNPLQKNPVKKWPKWPKSCRKTAA